MSTTRHILQSEVGFDLTTGQYILAGVFSGTWKYWTGSAWSVTFSAANLYTFGTGTQVTAATWTWVVASGIDPNATDDATIQMRGWESGITPTLADPPTWVVTDSYVLATVVSAINALTGQPTDDGFLPDSELFTDQNSQFSFVFADLEDSDGNAINMTGHSLVARFWRNGKSTLDFTGTVTASSTDGNDLLMTGASTASGLFRFAIWDSTSSIVRQHGTLNVIAAPITTGST